MARAGSRGPRRPTGGAGSRLDLLLDTALEQHFDNAQRLGPPRWWTREREEVGPCMFIINGGEAAMQVWHVDASAGVTSAFLLLSAGCLPTQLLWEPPRYTFRQALALVGVGAEHWDAAAEWAKDQRVPVR